MKKQKCKENERHCSGCGQPITIIPRLEGLPCNYNCCGCCEYAKISSCPKEQKEGTALEQLAEIQNKN